MKGLALLLGSCALVAFASSAAADLSDGKVKIGVINDQSGIYSDLSGMGGVRAAEMAIEDFGGTVLGQPIELVFADHQNKADIASNIVNKWIDEDQVDLISDLPSSSAMLAVQEIVRQKQRLVIVSTGATSDFTGKACSPYGIHWTYDTYALAHGTGKTLVEQGGDTWFFITADYAFGHALQRDTTAFIEEGGGKVLGSVLAPFPNQDFSSFLLQAQASGAKIIGLANAGGDTINSVKQAAEFGIVEAGQRLAGLLIFISDIHSLGLQTAQGVVLTTGFYWDLDDETRAWSKRFYERHGAMPTMTHAGVYSSITHYLKAVEAAGTDEPLAVAAKMRELPIEDFFAKNGRLREDNRMVHDMYLAQVKAPEESKYDWDYYKILATIPAEEAFRPLSESECPMVKK
ncbi:MAG TPA: ABC transporter substrate-binding protein [Kiloniellales bacterium]|nr:ABC transporter substrate-binding protein [Kiloniellales bacterium]